MRSRAQYPQAGFPPSGSHGTDNPQPFVVYFPHAQTREAHPRSGTRARLASGKGEYKDADPEDRDEYLAENVFFVPETARFAALKAEFKAQLKEESRLNRRILANFKKIHVEEP
jgi:hypothetical protein